MTRKAMNDVLLSPLAWGGGRYSWPRATDGEWRCYRGAAVKAPDGRMVDMVRGTPQDIARMVARSSALPSCSVVWMRTREISVWR